MTTAQLVVVITAFNRREYLRRALRTVAAQGLPRDQFDVIVSKNFRDNRLDDEARRFGFSLHECGPGTAGSQVVQALSSSTARLVAFLDDDDLWAATRLQHIVEKFDAHPHLQYYANTYHPIGEDGKVDYGRRRDSPAYFRALADGRIRVIDPDSQDLESIDNLFRTYPGNNSSIVVTRALLDSFTGPLKDIRTSIDHFLIVAALLKHDPIMIEHLPLTLWQRHPSNKSRIDASSYSRFQSNLEEVATRIGADNRVLLEMARVETRPALFQFLKDKVELLDELKVVLGGLRSRGGAFKIGLQTIRETATTGGRDYWSTALYRARLAGALSRHVARVALFLYLQKELAE
ncbi:MAG TPA: glycosyltransferase [Thermoplasmata archaeon]|nr:glycosyltransferase [Thermoplasmata archaeon]